MADSRQAVKPLRGCAAISSAGVVCPVFEGRREGKERGQMMIFDRCDSAHRDASALANKLRGIGLTPNLGNDVAAPPESRDGVT